MGAGLGLLRLRPCDFWAMTPREFGAAMGAILGDAQTTAPLAKRELVALMTRYPDSKDE